MNGITSAFTGRVGSDPELRYSQAGKPILRFSAAVDENTQATEDRAAAPATWVKVSVFADQALALADQLKKGSALYCEGRLRLDKWEDRTTGEPRAGLSLNARRCEIHGAIGKSAPPREQSPVADGTMATAWASAPGAGE